MDGAASLDFFVLSRADSVCILVLRVTGHPEGMEANQNLVLILFPQVSKLYLLERKTFLSSKMMNLQPQHIQKREKAEIKKLEK